MNRRRPADDPVALLQSLVRVPSVNPAGDPGVPAAQTGEAACAALVAQALEDIGAETRIEDVLPGRPNVIGQFPADRPGKPILLLCPHLDTVSVRGMSVDPFAAEVRDGRVYGRGATDTKGTITGLLWALAEMGVEKIAALEHEVWFAGLMGEEAGNEGAAALAKQVPKAHFALIGEPTRCQIVHSTKGVTWLQLSVRGKAAHSASPQMGDNAIYKMADVVRAVREELIPRLATERDPVLGRPTASVGLISGGTKVNIVPENCTVELDLRTVPAQSRPGFVEEVAALLRRTCPELQVRHLRSHRPLQTATDHPCIRALEAAGGKCVGAPWFCDGSVLAAGGIPAVAAGPGDIAQAHTADEFLALDDLHAGIDFYRRFLERV